MNLCGRSDRGVSLMKLRLATILCAAVVALGATAAAAFQEQQGSAAPAQQQAAPQATEKPAVEFSAPDAPKGSVGTEVRIPGLGKLGVLPKMDFGLELLYGAAGDSRAQEARPEATEDDDLRIRGTVKHRF